MTNPKILTAQDSPLAKLFRGLIITIFVAGLSSSANSQVDNLQPETGYFSGFYPHDSYYPIVKKVLTDSLSYYTDFRVVVLPSFKPEYLISLDTKESKTFLTFRIANKQIYDFPGPNSEKVESSTFKILFDPSLTKKIHELFFLAISNAKFSPNEGGVDGTSYFFMVFQDGYGLIGGQTRTPGTERMSGLVAISEWLKDCAKSGSLKNADSMTAKIDGLIKKFK